MAIKDVEFDILLKSTDRQFQFERDVVFTNDRNSVRVIFNIKDMTTSDLSGATAQVQLYMHDGSFYQIPNGDVIKDGTSFKYVLKGNEGKHRGVVKAQLVVMFSGDSDLASRKCEFEIDTGLDDVVATEVMIKDWTTLLKEARDYIDDFVDAEAARQSTFNQSQQTRQTTFNQSESSRQQTFEDNESTRQANETERVSNEEIRQALYEDLLENGVLQTNINAKLQSLELQYAPRLTEVTTQLDQKANQEDVRLRTVKLEDTDMSETLLQQMAGNTPINSVPLNKSVDYRKIEENAVSSFHSDFVRTGKNLYDVNKITKDTYINTSGEVATIDGYATSKPIAIKAGLDYSIQKARWIAKYDNDMNLIERIDQGTNVSDLTTTASSDGYMVVSGYEGVADRYEMDEIQVEQGSAVTNRENYNVEMPDLKLQKKNMYRKENGVTVIKSGDTYIIKGTLKNNETIEIETEKHGSANGAFRFRSTKINGKLIHNTQDDITPVRTFVAVGGNHGYDSIIIVSMSDHGKTNNDLGSVWTDGTTSYTLLKIEGNDLTLGCPYTFDTNGMAISTRVMPTTNLAHVSGAANSGDINTEYVGTGQLYPSVNNVSVKYILDGEEVMEDGEYNGDKLQVFESYNIMDYQGIIDFAQSNVGVSYENDNVDGVLNLSNSYEFGESLKCTTSHGLRALKNATLGRCGLLQSVAIDLSGYVGIRYMPGVSSKDGYDYADGVNHADIDSTVIFNHSDNITEGEPPNHVVDWLYENGKRKYGFTIGYIPDKTNSKNADRLNAYTTWDMRSTKKIYPVAVENKTLADGDYLNFQGYRNYLVDEEAKGFTNANVVKDSVDTYVIIDLNQQSPLQSVELIDGIGKTISVVQSDNLDNKNETVDVNGLVISSQSSLSNGIFKVK